MMLDYQKICSKLLEDLPSKQREVILRRFGLESGEKETLQKIGENFGVTRERVRQIENEGFLRLKKEKDYLKKVFFCFSNFLEGSGGLKREDILLENLGGQHFQNYVYFLLHLEESFYRFSETQDVYPFWTLEKDIEQRLKEALEKVITQLQKEQKPISRESLINLANNQSSQFFFSSLEIAKTIEKGPLGNFGLVSWSEIKPKGVKDMAYLALKKEGKPLHFREIAKVASSLNGNFAKRKEILPQTVHNELIRDERFVLVGRGIYGLKDWGYMPGSVKDIISDILRESKEALEREEIIERVKEQRFVKYNTILLNLGNKDYFSKDSQGRYQIKNI